MPFDGKPSERVICEIADWEGIGPSQLETPLYDVIDPEALDSMFKHNTIRKGSTDIKIEFSYLGYEIIVESPGHVVVQPSARAQLTDDEASKGSTVD